MENKVVCDYCGTIYDGSREKCPLCVSTTRAEAAPAAPRRRLTEEERDWLAKKCAAIGA